MEYTKGRFERDMLSLQRHHDKEEMLLQEGKESDIIGGYLADSLVRLMAEQFAMDEEDADGIERLLWWFITDNMFGRVGDNPEGDVDSPIESAGEFYDYLVVA